MTLTFDLWPWTFTALRYHVSILCTKFERNWIIRGWVIDYLARFRRAILGVGHFCPTVLRGARTQLYQIWQEHRAIIPIQEICFSVRISYCVFKCGRLRVEWCWKRLPNFSLFDPVKFRRRVGKISIPIQYCWSFTYDEPPKYIRWPSTARLLSTVDW